MKICVFVSSYEGTGSEFEKYDEYQDPSLYIKNHEFSLQIIRKETAVEEIDKILKCEKFDFLWNFFSGYPWDNITGIEATIYLESFKIPIIGVSSKYLKMGKIDFKNLMEKVGVMFPKFYPEENIEKIQKFPVIVKPSNGCGSLFMTLKSVCKNIEEVKEQVEILKNKVPVPPLIDEFIYGDEFSITVIETKNGIFPCIPIKYNFGKNTKDEEKFMDFSKKFDGVSEGALFYELFKKESDPELFDKIQEVGISAYASLGVFGSGYARLDVRVKNREIFVLEINDTPAFFSAIGNTFGDDEVIAQTFSGGHEELMNVILESKTLELERQKFYKSLNADQLEKSVFYSNLELFNLNGTILDLGCGEGEVGKFLIHKSDEYNLTGVDFFTNLPLTLPGYQMVKNMRVENAVWELETFDHVVVGGVLSFLDKKTAQIILKRIFNMAQKSVILCIENFGDSFNEALIEKGIQILEGTNYLDSVLNFISNEIVGNKDKIWELKFKECGYFWNYEFLNIEINGTVLRYEKL